MVHPHHRVLGEALRTHPLYAAIDSLPALRRFMEHHVYAVWDFMSLIKALQAQLAPSGIPWMPPANSRHACFVNRLVLEEESDMIADDASQTLPASHFETYCRAMKETGADTRAVNRFLGAVRHNGILAALETDIPPPAVQFMRFTFSVIETGETHLIAAALAYGREDLVPELFRALLTRVPIDRSDAPMLYAYMERHVELDGQAHGPAAVQMVEELCAGSPALRSEALEVAEQALNVRSAFWDGILDALRESPDRP